MKTDIHLGADQKHMPKPKKTMKYYSLSKIGVIGCDWTELLMYACMVVVRYSYDGGKTDTTIDQWWYDNGPLTRYVKLRVVYAPGMPGTFSTSLTSKGNR